MYPYQLNRMMMPYRNERKTNDITVEGVGRIMKNPDMAIVTFGVVTQGEDVTEVQRENEIAMQKVINGLLEYDIKEEDIRTVQYTIYPRYDYIEGRQVLAGYQINNIIEVKVYDLQTLGDLLADAVNNGVNNQQGIEFTLKDSQINYREALNKAVLDGKYKAMEVAETLGVGIDPIPASVIERSTFGQAVQIARMGVVKEAESIQPGNITIEASVIEKFNIIT